MYFKWGLIMSKAGHAVFSTGETPWEGEEAWRYHMQFNSLGMAETFYKMRDTLSTLLSPQGRPISSSKHTDEGGFYMVDELIFSNEQPFDIRSTRRARGRTRIDTVLTAGGCVYDMLGAVMYARSIDFDNLRPGAEFPFKVAVGKDIVNVRFRYTGPSTAKQGDASYGAHHFYIDVYDAAFAQSKEAAEVWIGNDDNHIPVRVRAKLKIGAAEVHYKESSGLRHPLSCRLAGK